jgi:beta-fructofuranosidase
MQPTAGFRDPSVWRDAKYWYMIVGSGIIDREGAVLLYRATIPDGPHADWTYLHPLFTAPGNGRHTPDTVDAGAMFECPDFFLLDGRHVLLYSTERKVFWMTGDLDPITQRFAPRTRGLLDAGAYYAPKSMLGPVTPGGKAERILWGWIPEKRDQAAFLRAGWSGCMALPRILHVDDEGQLTLHIPAAVDALAGPPQPCAPVATLIGTAARLDLQLRRGGACTVLCGGKEMLRLAVHPSGDKLDINGSPIPFQRFEPITAYIDASVIELFVGPRYAHTLRVYPDLPQRPSLHIEVTGPNSTGTIRPMHPISPNRLT